MKTTNVSNEKNVNTDDLFIKAEEWSDGTVIESDLLIIGSGLAGLWAAITAADKGVEKIVLVDKGSIGQSSNSNLTLGGTIFLYPTDDKTKWMEELVKSADYLRRQEMWDDLLTTSYSRLEKLQSLGVKYKPFIPVVMPRLISDGNKNVALNMGPSWNGLHAGRAVIGALLSEIRKRKGIRYFSKTMITQLLKQENQIAGAIGVNRLTGNSAIFKTKAAIIAAGQCSFRGQHAIVEIHTGDGFALAYNSGATLNNMEFLSQDIDPGAFGLEGGSLLGMFGCKLINGEKADFMRKYDPKNGSKAAVKISTRSMAKEVKAGRGPIVMDFSSLFYSLIGQRLWRKQLQPNTWQRVNEYRLEEVGHYVTKKPEPFYSFSQGIFGAVKADARCSTSVPGLFAAGIALSTDPGKVKGCPSARSMWSGEKSALSASEYISNSTADLDLEFAESQRKKMLEPLNKEGGKTPDDILIKIQKVIFSPEVSILKNEKSLKIALEKIIDIKNEDYPLMYASNPHELIKYYETQNMLLCAELFLRASLERRETRECHYREDYPETNNKEWLQWINFSKGPDEEPQIELEKVPFDKYPIKPPKEA